MREVLKRRAVPGMIIRLSQVDSPARARAALRRARGGRGRLELYFGFDDPSSAVAVIELARRVASRPVDLVLLPVVERGIPGDPAAGDKRRYALEDARRLARRSGMTLVRDEPLTPDDTAFLAAWVAGAEQGPALTAFCVAALEALWFASSGPVVEADYAALWRTHVGGAPTPDATALRANERRMVRRGPYETPAAVVHGQWFFAHERIAQIVHRLDSLGWRSAP